MGGRRLGGAGGSFEVLAALLVALSAGNALGSPSPPSNNDCLASSALLPPRSPSATPLPLRSIPRAHSQCDRERVRVGPAGRGKLAVALLAPVRLVEAVVELAAFSNGVEASVLYARFARATGEEGQQVEEEEGVLAWSRTRGRRGSRGRRGGILQACRKLLLILPTVWERRGRRRRFRGGRPSLPLIKLLSSSVSSPGSEVRFRQVVAHQRRVYTAASGENLGRLRLHSPRENGFDVSSQACPTI